jgi:hypothetical protein
MTPANCLDADGLCNLRNGIVTLRDNLINAAREADRKPTAG